MCPLGCAGRRQVTVCGSDGDDYRSECELHQHACKNQKNLRVQYQGPCGKLRPLPVTGRSLVVSSLLSPLSSSLVHSAPYRYLLFPLSGSSSSERSFSFSPDFLFLFFPFSFLLSSGDSCLLPKRRTLCVCVFLF
ncbi:Agrin [Liparis tanakae]|uniref:Agrin n=1 Tax=Liparis tanakae TaxID=230148 RepID=A0A4Z2E0F1_9TELE|nr:Agrin [Liparis tanakae]